MQQQDTSTYGATKTQNRSFTYSSLGRLVTASNPEADGPTNYTYWPNGARHTQTDARGVTITYTVNALDRVLKKDYSGGSTATVAARYCYDSLKYSLSADACATDSSRGADYSQGALTDTAAWKLVGGTPTVISETQYNSIDALGRVTASTQITSVWQPCRLLINMGILPKSITVLL